MKHLFFLLVTQHVVQMVVHLKVLKVDFFTARQLHCLKKLEVEQLKFIVSDQRSFAKIENLLCNLIKDRFRYPDKGSSQHFCPLRCDDVLAAAYDVEKKDAVLVQAL